MKTTYSERPAMFRSNPLGFLLALILVPVGIGLIIFLVWYLICMSTRLELVGNDLVLTKGLLSKERTELDVTGIRTVKVYQSLLNRLFKVGTISVFTAGDDAEIVVAGLPDPHQLRELINKQQDA